MPDTLIAPKNLEVWTYLDKIAEQPLPEVTHTLFQEYTKIGGWCGTGEGRLMYCIAKDTKVKGTIVEIGNFKGYSTMFLALAAKEIGENVWAVDRHSEKMGIDYNESIRTCHTFLDNILKYDFEDIIIPIVAKSEIVLKGWKLPIKFIFIDGDHTYEAVIRDVEWLEYLVEGGSAYFHDISPNCDVDKALNDTIRKDNRYIEWGEGWFVKKGNEWWK